jgi:sorting nexin-8
MSLFGDDDEGFKQTSNSKSLFGEGAPAPKATSSSLFADDTANDSPWGMPTPKKAARGDMIKNLLRATEVPESYIDTFDSMLNSGHGQGGSASSEGVTKLFEDSGISQEEQSRLLQLVAPSGVDAGLGRSEFNVLLALIGLWQEGEEATLDGVDERRASMYIPTRCAVIVALTSQQSSLNQDYLISRN